MTTCGHCGTPTQPTVFKRTKGYCDPCATLTIEEAYTLLKISRSTFHREVKRGNIHTRRASTGRVLVARWEIVAKLGGV